MNRIIGKSKSHYTIQATRNTSSPNKKLRRSVGEEERVNSGGVRGIEVWQMITGQKCVVNFTYLPNHNF